MRIPKFWSKATAEGVSPGGGSVAFSCWRPSDTSAADAHESALAAAGRIRDALLRGQKLDRYAYGCMPLREEVINTLSDDGGGRVAVVTRNGYGSLVLCAERVMFADIDFPEATAAETAKHFFARLFGGARTAPASAHEAKARENVAQFMAARPDWGMRLYRTCSGLRGIVTHALFEPAASGSLRLLEQLGSDPLYIRLCKAQECFRARLTPKPWRCGHCVPPVRFPLETAEAAVELKRWEAEYQDRQRDYATCRFVAELGSGGVHPDAERVVQLHDFVTRCNEPRALA